MLGEVEGGGGARAGMGGISAGRPQQSEAKAGGEGAEVAKAPAPVAGPTLGPSDITAALNRIRKSFEGVECFELDKCAHVHHVDVHV